MAEKADGSSRRDLLLAFSGFALASSITDAFAASDQQIAVIRAGTRPSIGTPDHFTGVVRVTSAFQGTAPSRVGGAFVAFEAGARTFWHTHPLGQTLVVTEGTGLVQHWGGPVQELWPGDLVWIPPGVKHWHGAAPVSSMTHFAISEALDGKTVDWLEMVSDDQYPR